MQFISNLKQLFKRKDDKRQQQYIKSSSNYTLSDIKVEKAVDKYLQQLWEDMQDGYTTEKFKFDGATNLALGLGIFNKEKYELWNLRVEKCPNPDHFGRSWCAYCGDVGLDENEYDD